MLKNRDGTPYKLSSPNVLMRDQQWIREDNLIFHNFAWPAFTLESQATPVSPRQFGETVVQEAVAIPAVVAVESQEPPAATEPEIPDPPKTDPKPETSITKFENGVVVHCLPVEWDLRQDDLYGEKYKVRRYGHKLTFEAVMMERGDLAISLWTSATFKTSQGEVETKKAVQPGSVIFPTRYATGRKFADYRWWKVQKLEKYDDGILITAVVTDVQPSFAN